jgi:hypothetical protein
MSRIDLIQKVEALDVIEKTPPKMNIENKDLKELLSTYRSMEIIWKSERTLFEKREMIWREERSILEKRLHVYESINGNLFSLPLETKQTYPPVQTCGINR